MSLHSWRLSSVAFAKEWWAALTATFCTYGLLLTAQPPRESAESAYFFFCRAWLVFLRAELEESLHCLLVRRRPLSLDLGGMDQGHIALPGMLATSFLLSLYNLPWFLLAGKMIPRAAKGGFGARLLTMIGLSAFWVSIEWARGSLLSISLVSFVGYAVGRPAILQTLPWTGAWSVSFFLVFFNLTIASYLHHLLIRRRKRQGGAFSSFCPDFYMESCFSFSWFRLSFFSGRAPWRIGRRFER